MFRLLTDGTSVSENRATGEKSSTVRFIDFDKVSNNRFIAVCQFKVRILGTEHHIVPDVVLFVNGIPVVVEAKSPKVKDALSVIDYVIVHELAHLLESNHTPDFWNIVRAKVPGAEKSKEWLRAHGQLLEDEI